MFTGIVCWFVLREVLKLILKNLVRNLYLATPIYLYKYLWLLFVSPSVERARGLLQKGLKVLP